MIKYKNELLIVGVSLAITGFFSVIAGFAGSAIIGTFWGWFWITFLLQIVIFSGWNSYLLQQQSQQLQESEIKLLEQLSKFTITMSCAYCQRPNDVPIQLDQKNTFKCQACNQTNGVFMQFSSTTITTPIESLKLSVPDSNKTIDFKV